MMLEAKIHWPEDGPIFVHSSTSLFSFWIDTDVFPKVYRQLFIPKLGTIKYE